MKTMWKKVLIVVLVAVVSLVTSIGAVTYMVKHNAKVRAVLMNDDEGMFKQPLRLTGYHASAAENTDFTYAADMAVHAVVHIKATAKSQPSNSRRNDFFDPFEFFFGDGSQFQQRSPRPRIGAGSGVIISTDGYIVTNNHVVESADELEVTLNDNRKFSAKVIGTDPNTDIALIKVDAKDLKTLPFGNSEQLKVGEWVLAVGNPFNLTSTVTAGIVSAKGRAILSGNTNLNKIESFIQTDAAVNAGNSGGDRQFCRLLFCGTHQHSGQGGQRLEAVRRRTARSPRCRDTKCRSCRQRRQESERVGRCLCGGVCTTQFGKRSRRRSR